MKRKKLLSAIKHYVLHPKFYAGLALPFFLVFNVVFWNLWWDYSNQVQRAFGERNWSVPSRVYARPPELYPSKKLTLGKLRSKLDNRQYVRSDTATRSGQYSLGNDQMTVALRAFRFLDGRRPARRVRISFDNQQIESIHQIDGDTSTRLNVLRLEPLRIGTFFSHRYEDWVPLTHEETPDLLRRTLVTIEDQRFYDHFGLDVRGILRAAKANFMAGEIVQGGSTLTQQLVKNRFLGNQQTFWRKFREAVMSLLTEWYFDKKTILQAYINEAYMGQIGKKSIQGFGKASRYYFGSPARDLTPGQIAMLVGLIRGPSLYNPRRDLELATKRRNFVLDRMLESNLISRSEFKKYHEEPLQLAPKESISLTPYPDFLELVKQRLRRDFKSEELRQRGLRVYTTLIPETQRALQNSVRTLLPDLNKLADNSDTGLQTAMVAARAKTGEITGLLGGRRIGFPGFNRALSPRRSVGSVIKPAVYLTALKQPKKYSLLTRMADTEFRYTPRGETQPWTPTNYGGDFHDTVPLLEALTNSYNAATARLGLDLGILDVHETIRELGIDKPLHRHPSLVLGTVSLSPLQVAQMYQTLAGRGYRAPLKALRGVLNRKGNPLTRNPLELERTIDPGPVFTVNYALRRVTRVGTAKSMRYYLSDKPEIAGKTGTTQRYRDSWFAGFTRNRVMSVWIGHDDNSPTGLTGAMGALRLWSDIAHRLNVHSINTNPPTNVELHPVDTKSWLPTNGNCKNEIQVPFLRGSKPDKLAPCARDDSYFFSPF